jgi:NAD(P)-dependent dehydrogenase (short-subunit alcohol dehydrogenase family)
LIQHGRSPGITGDAMKPIEQQTILVTGATDGIGKLTAMRLAVRQARVIVHGRNKEKVDRVVTEMQHSTGNSRIEGFTADLSSLALVRGLAEDVLAKHSSLDVLINNAGVGSADPRLSMDGYELRFAVNHLAPFLLTQRLLPALRKAAPARIVNVASAGQHPIDFADVMLEKEFEGFRAYCQSKLALIMFTIDLAARLQKDHITVTSLHPGTFLDTNMVRRAGVEPWGDPQSGADAVAFLATAPELEGVTGKYFDEKAESRALDQAYDEKARQQLWSLSMQLTGLD